MTGTRRRILGVLTLAAASLGVRPQSAQAAAKPGGAAPGDEGRRVFCLYHCDFGDPVRFSQVLTNIDNHYAAYGNDKERIKIVLVAHSQAIKFFLSDHLGTPWEKETTDPEIFRKLSGLSERGLQVNLCQFTFKRLNVASSKVQPASFVSFVQSGVATVGDLQSKGYSYLKVG